MHNAFEAKFTKILHELEAGKLPGGKLDLRGAPLTNDHVLLLHETLTNNFHTVKNISEIDLAFANLQELPLGIFKDCDGLRILNLDNNMLKKLPKLPDRPYALQDFFANNNPLKVISQHYFDNCVSLKAVYLSNTQIDEVPSLNDSLSLSWLHLNSNPIRKFPERFFHYLEHLDTLYINDTKLRELPNLSACTKLHEVWVDDIYVEDGYISDTAKLIVTKK